MAYAPKTRLRRRGDSDDVGHRQPPAWLYAPAPRQPLYGFCMWCGAVVVLGECCLDKPCADICVARTLGEAPCREGGGQ